MRNKQQVDDLLKAFRESRNQVQKAIDISDKPKTFSKGYSKKKSQYDAFLDKYDNLEESIDSFKTQDLMYFFKTKAEENGIKYVIANMKRDMAVFKKLQNNYSAREICLMIEFVFCSNQNYLDKDSIQPTVLISSWCNTLYRDSQLWLEDKYIPYEKKQTVKQQIKNREWKHEISGEHSKIGEW